MCVGIERGPRGWRHHGSPPSPRARAANAALCAAVTQVRRSACEPLRLRHFLAGSDPVTTLRGPYLRGGPVRRRIPAANGPTQARSAVIDRGGPVHRRIPAANRPTLPSASGRRANATHNQPRSLPSVTHRPRRHARPTPERNAQASRATQALATHHARPATSAPRRQSWAVRYPSQAVARDRCPGVVGVVDLQRNCNIATTLRNPPIPSAPPARLRRLTNQETPATASTARGHDPRSDYLP